MVQVYLTSRSCEYWYQLNLNLYNYIYIANMFNDNGKYVSELYYIVIVV